VRYVTLAQFWYNKAWEWRCFGSDYANVAHACIYYARLSGARAYDTTNAVHRGADDDALSEMLSGARAYDTTNAIHRDTDGDALSELLRGEPEIVGEDDDYRER